MNYNIEHIVWIDSSSSQGGWHPLQTALDLSEPVSCSSVGHVIKENDVYITLAAHISNEDAVDGSAPVVDGVMTIPKVCIKTRKMLVERVAIPQITKVRTQ